jgi:hypothetical protein
MENRTSRGRERLRSGQEDPVRAVSIVDPANQARPVVFLVLENPTSTPSNAGVAMSRFLGAAQRDYVGAVGEPEHRKIRPDGLCEIARRQMGIVLLGHPCVGMADAPAKICFRSVLPKPNLSLTPVTL